MSKREELPILTTPVGTLVFPYLTKPRAHKDAPEKLAYDTGFLLPNGAKTDEFIAAIDEWAKQSQAAHKLKPGDKPYGEHTDKEKNVVAGVTKFKFKLRANAKTRDGEVWERKPKIVDADGQVIPGRIRIGSGTQARIKYQPYLAQGGNKSWVVLQPLVVQIIKLVEIAEADYGMEAYEGGGYRHGVDSGAGDEAGGGEQPTSGGQF